MTWTGWDRGIIIAQYTNHRKINDIRARECLFPIFSAVSFIDEQPQPFIWNSNQRKSHQNSILKDLRTLVISCCFNHLDYAYMFDNVRLCSRYFLKNRRIPFKVARLPLPSIHFPLFVVTASNRCHDPDNFGLLEASFYSEKTTKRNKRDSRKMYFYKETPAELLYHATNDLYFNSYITLKKAKLQVKLVQFKLFIRTRNYCDTYIFVILPFWFGNFQMRYVHFPATKPSTGLTHFARKYFGQSRDRNCESWRDRANNQDCLSFHRCSARPVIFNCFVRHPEGGQRISSSKVRQLHDHFYTLPLSFFFLLEDDTIPRFIYPADPLSSPRSCYEDNI